MGRIKTSLVKRVTKKLVEEHPNEFTEDYAKNKEILKKYANMRSSKLVNATAGYAARLVKQAKSGKEKRRISTEDILRKI